MDEKIVPDEIIEQSLPPKKATPKPPKKKAAAEDLVEDTAPSVQEDDTHANAIETEADQPGPAAGDAQNIASSVQEENAHANTDLNAESEGRSEAKATQNDDSSEETLGDDYDADTEEPLPATKPPKKSNPVQDDKATAKPPKKAENKSNSRLAAPVSARTPKEEKNRLEKLFRTKKGIKRMEKDGPKVLSQEDLFKEATLELERASRGYILTGTVSAVNNDKFGPHAIVFYRGYKICIYAKQFREWPELNAKLYENEKDMHFKIMRKQIGATIDFIIMNTKFGGGIDIENRTAIGDRLSAMRIKRNSYWLPDKQGETEIKQGSRVEARVVNVTNSTVIVEVGGLEISLPATELSWSYLQNAQTQFAPGEVIPIDILSIKTTIRPDGGVIVSATASHRTTQPNEQYEAARQLSAGMILRGIVTNTAVASSAIFVKLDNGAVVKCNPPNGVFEMPNVYDQVNVLIRNVQFTGDAPRVSGEIRGILKKDLALY